MFERLTNEQQMTDEELSSLFASAELEQSKDALGELCHRHRSKHLNAASRICFGRPVDIENLVADLFERLLEKRTTFNPARGSWGGWAYVILRSMALIKIRQSKQAKFVWQVNGMEWVPDPVSDTKWEIYRDSFDECVSGLTEQEQRAIALRRLGASVREVQEKTGTKTWGARQLVERAETKLKLCLEGKANSRDS